MLDQQDDKSQLGTRLLQKIFIVVLVVTYVIDTFFQLRSRTGESRQFIELLLLLLIPAGYFIVSYIINSKKQLRLVSIFQSLVASIAAYVFWNTMVSVVQNGHRAYTANLKMYYATASITGVLVIVVLLYLRSRKNW